MHAEVEATMQAEVGVEQQVLPLDSSVGAEEAAESKGTIMHWNAETRDRQEAYLSLLATRFRLQTRR
jgi:hypothetical protein